ncbi:MAG: ABC transporter ATP-binding protein [Lautropia sp.]|nr:ABC transporter ATP-binding protein [Lautropia sp.]
MTGPEAGWSRATGGKEEATAQGRLWLRLLSRLTEVEDRQRHETALQWLYGFVVPHRWAIAALFALSLIATLLALVQPWLTKLAIDQGLLGGRFDWLVGVMAAMFVLGLAATALGGLNRYWHTRLSARILLALRLDVYAHLQALSPRLLAERRLGDTLSRLDGDVAEIQRFAIDALFSAVSNGLALIGAWALLLSLSWQLSLMMLVLLPLELWWLRRSRRWLEQDSRALREKGADVSAFLVESLGAIKFIQANNQAPAAQARLHELGDEYLARLLRLQITEFQAQSLPAALGLLSRACVFLLGGWWIIQGSWQLGSLIAFMSYLTMGVNPLKALLGLYVALQRMVVSLERVRVLRELPVTVVSPAAPLPIPDHPVALEIDQLDYRYPGRPEPVLRGASARIEAGERVGIQGASGVGKSTLIDLLLRFDDPQQGTIRLGGIDLRRLDLQALRHHVCLLSQESILFNTSLRDNLCLASPTATDARIRWACQQAGLGEWLDGLPKGLDTPLGERGQALSGGQRQRLALARAFLRSPSILVFDEATSALDERTERDVLDAVDRHFGHCTRIIISHRPCTLQWADRHVELRQGQLIPLERVDRGESARASGSAARRPAALEAVSGGEHEA